MTEVDKLMAAIQEETKALQEQSILQIEQQFILNNWNLFSSSRSEVYETIKSSKNASGTDILCLLGLSNTYIEKVSKIQLLRACYKFKHSKIAKRFNALAGRTGSGTVFFVVNKSGIVVTNQYNLDKENDFTHVMRKEGSNDVYWAPVDTISSVVFYGS